MDRLEDLNRSRAVILVFDDPRHRFERGPVVGPVREDVLEDVERTGLVMERALGEQTEALPKLERGALVRCVVDLELDVCTQLFPTLGVA